MRTGNQISIKIRCKEDLVSPSHPHLKSADHWLPLSSSLCLQSYCERISQSQSSRAPDILLWSHYRDRAVIISLPMHVCGSYLFAVSSCFCLREFQITHDNWCHLLIADLYTLLAKKESSHLQCSPPSSNVLHDTTSGCTHRQDTEGCYDGLEPCPCLGLRSPSPGPIVSSPCCQYCGKKEILEPCLLIYLFTIYLFYQDAQRTPHTIICVCVSCSVVSDSSQSCGL